MIKGFYDLQTSGIIRFSHITSDKFSKSIKVDALLTEEHVSNCITSSS
jgi:hypothetical protein